MAEVSEGIGRGDEMSEGTVTPSGKSLSVSQSAPVPHVTGKVHSRAAGDH